jgi:hypothetical protein
MALFICSETFCFENREKEKAMKQKVLSIVLTCILVAMMFVLGGCGEKTNAASPQDDPTSSQDITERIDTPPATGSDSGSSTQDPPGVHTIQIEEDDIYQTVDVEMNNVDPALFREDEYWLGGNRKNGFEARNAANRSGQFWLYPYSQASDDENGYDILGHFVSFDGKFIEIDLTWKNEKIEESYTKSGKLDGYGYIEILDVSAPNDSGYLEKQVLLVFRYEPAWVGDSIRIELPGEYQNLPDVLPDLGDYSIFNLRDFHRGDHAVSFMVSFRWIPTR